MLPARLVALQLLQRLRDEAHRFAIEHHRIRRDRSMKASILDELPGIGPLASARCYATSARRSGSSPPPARSSSRSPGCPARSPGASTSNSTGPAPPPPRGRRPVGDSAAHAARLRALPKRLSALPESLVCRIRRLVPGRCGSGLGEKIRSDGGETRLCASS